MARDNFSQIIKDWIRIKLGIKLRVRSTQTKNPYYDAWIPSDKRDNPHGPITYSQLFTTEFGNHCLRIIYGQETPIKAWAGNVAQHSISMHKAQWEKAMETWPDTN